MKARLKFNPEAEVTISRSDYVDLCRQKILIEGSASFEDGDDTSPFPGDVPPVGSPTPKQAPSSPESKEGKDQ